MPGTLVFGGISRQWCSQLFHAACEKAGIELQPRQGLHSLRHSLGHAMLSSGSSLPEIQRALRHRSLSSTSVYLEADAADVDQARAKAIHGASPAQPPMSLDEIRREITRLSKLALAIEAAQDMTMPAPVAAAEQEALAS